ncbi:apyrase-like [Olea europaea subsp. europaea]|uniref:Apyrase-like n=1 Tax=Olea europaea subsp. europaea TaxID=158383 RepID=A0A8S0RVS1_OLEEU|nr:apyrase-like [Olea europaea subsp. europaea]
MVKGRSSQWFLILFALIFLLPVYSDSFPGLSRKFSFNALILNVGFDNYAVIFDAGSTGSRVHVFRFNQDLNLLHVGKDFELLVTAWPLLQKAEAAVPKQLHSKKPLRLGATAGLRLLDGDEAERILEALFKKESTLEYKAEWVSILEGSEEGAYLWVAINYLLGTLGKKYSSTVGVIDLGGGSVQMAYAIAKESAANAPVAKDAYVLEKNIVGTTYYVYSHSYLNYGLKAARAQSLKLSGSHGNPCVTNGYKGTYKYSGVIYNVTAPLSGTSLRRCRALTGEVLKLDAPCPYRNCSFDGVWNGGGGDGRKNLYVASFFYGTAVGASIIKQNVPSVKVPPIVYWNAAKVACRANVETIKSIFPQIDKRDVPFLCMDLVYEYTLLVHGFGIDRLEEMTVLKQVEYKGSLVEAAWPLGCAIEVLSSPSA